MFCPQNKIFYSEYSLLGMVFRKDHWHCCTSSSGSAQIEIVFLEVLDSAGRLSLKVLNTHPPPH
jgi:hypothetical protein